MERSTQPTGPETREILLFGVACALLLAAKLLALVHYRIDSDEPQHLHVVWSWLHAGVGYRDFFDNHTPFFHLMCVPVLALVGEHAATLLALRLVSLASYLGVLVLAGALARTFTTPRLARWCALLLGAFPPFFLVSTEYRPDVLWALLWLACLNVLVRSDWRAARVFGAFLILGAAFCVSMKSTLMLAVLLLAGVVFIPATRRDLRPSPPAMVKPALAALSGLGAFPMALTAFLASQRALPAAWECVIAHNLLPESPATVLAHTAAWFFWLAVPVAVSAWAWRRLHCPADRRLIFVFLLATLFLVTLRCHWRCLTPEDYPPLYALFVPLIVTVGWRLRLHPDNARIIRFAPWVAFAACLLLSAAQGRLWTNQTSRKVQLAAEALRLAPPGTYVMDAKGESLFRPRPTRLVLEHLTLLRLNHHLLTDDIAERLVAKRVPVVIDFKLTNGAARFVNAEYLPVAWRLRTLGKWLRPDPRADQATYDFEVPVPETYVFLGRKGALEGKLDGAPLSGAMFLAAGHHRFCAPADPGQVALFWAHAYACGYTPFVAVPPDARVPGD